MNIKRLLLVAVPVLTVAACASPIMAQATTATCGPEVVAHRGGTEHFVENTRKAWNDTMNHSTGTGWIETDVQFTKDDVPVIMHDATVDRTTDGTGNVSDLTLAQLRALHTSDGQYVPTFYEYLTDVKAHAGWKAMPEIKESPRNETEWHNFLVRFDWLDMGGSSLTYSFNASDVQRAETEGLNAAVIDQLGDRPSSWITDQGTHTWLKHQWSVTAARENTWEAGGVSTYAWTVDTPTDWARMQGDGVKGLITNKPLAYESWLNANCH